jgi:hypothetical protein
VPIIGGSANSAKTLAESAKAALCECRKAQAQARADSKGCNDELACHDAIVIAKNAVKTDLLLDSSNSAVDQYSDLTGTDMCGNSGGWQTMSGATDDEKALAWFEQQKVAFKNHFDNKKATLEAQMQAVNMAVAEQTSVRLGTGLYQGRQGCDALTTAKNNKSSDCTLLQTRATMNQCFYRSAKKNRCDIYTQCRIDTEADWNAAISRETTDSQDRKDAWVAASKVACMVGLFTEDSNGKLQIDASGSAACTALVCEEACETALDLSASLGRTFAARAACPLPADPCAEGGWAPSCSATETAGGGSYTPPYLVGTRSPPTCGGTPTAVDLAVGQVRETCNACSGLSDWHAEDFTPFVYPTTTTTTTMMTTTPTTIDGYIGTHHGHFKGPRLFFAGELRSNGQWSHPKSKEECKEQCEKHEDCIAFSTESTNRGCWGYLAQTGAEESAGTDADADAYVKDNFCEMQGYGFTEGADHYVWSTLDEAKRDCFKDIKCEGFYNNGVGTGFIRGGLEYGNLFGKWPSDQNKKAWINPARVPASNAGPEDYDAAGLQVCRPASTCYWTLEETTRTDPPGGNYCHMTNTLYACKQDRKDKTFYANEYFSWNGDSDTDGIIHCGTCNGGFGGDSGHIRNTVPSAFYKNMMMTCNCGAYARPPHAGTTTAVAAGVGSFTERGNGQEKAAMYSFKANGVSCWLYFTPAGKNPPCGGHALAVTFSNIGSIASLERGTFVLSGTKIMGLNLGNNVITNSVDTGDVIYMSIDDISRDQVYGLTANVGNEAIVYALDVSLDFQITTCTYSGKTELLRVNMEGEEGKIFVPQGIVVSNGFIFVLATESFSGTPDHLEVVEIAQAKVVGRVPIIFHGAISNCKSFVYYEHGGYFFLLDTNQVLWKLEFNTAKTELTATQHTSNTQNILVMGWN